MPLLKTIISLVNDSRFLGGSDLNLGGTALDLLRGPPLGLGEQRGELLVGNDLGVGGGFAAYVFFYLLRRNKPG
ncbi:hypothetical protein PM023_14445 [Halorubrum ezzemoulense]|uniref:hypothetical protein n=1 Tax=Halorubrum ezzemoulense TaxID=337243 RepID=UPI00233130D7|nr:hypothetical protein [Halorubrum ezzemoulense]MDB2225866.1 hypothetical protein [Halorubrum ezzemoulense]